MAKDMQRLYERKNLEDEYEGVYEVNTQACVAVYLFFFFPVFFRNGSACNVYHGLQIIWV